MKSIGCEEIDLGFMIGSQDISHGVGEGIGCDDIGTGAGEEYEGF